MLWSRWTMLKVCGAHRPPGSASSLGAGLEAAAAARCGLPRPAAAVRRPERWAAPGWSAGGPGSVFSRSWSRTAGAPPPPGTRSPSAGSAPAAAAAPHTWTWCLFLFAASLTSTTVCVSPWRPDQDLSAKDPLCSGRWVTLWHFPSLHGSLKACSKVWWTVEI